MKIHMDPAAQPQFFRPRPVPLALRPHVERELKRLVQDKVIEPVQCSEWAAPLFLQSSQTVLREYVVTYKMTVNKH